MSLNSETPTPASLTREFQHFGIDLEADKEDKFELPFWMAEKLAIQYFDLRTQL